MSYLKQCATSVPMVNGRYPCLQILWTLNEDGLGYVGKAQVWKDGNTKDGEEHEISVRLGTPLGGGLWLSFDTIPSGYGCWSMATISTCNEITPAILGMANAWAVETLKRKLESLSHTEGGISHE